MFFVCMEVDGVAWLEPTYQCLYVQGRYCSTFFGAPWPFVDGKALCFPGRLDIASELRLDILPFFDDVSLVTPSCFAFFSCVDLYECLSPFCCARCGMVLVLQFVLQDGNGVGAIFISRGSVSIFRGSSSFCASDRGRDPLAPLSLSDGGGCHRVVQIPWRLRERLSTSCFFPSRA